MTLKLLEFDVFSGLLDDILIKNKTIINTINPHSYVVSKKDEEFKKSLLRSNYIMPDGIGFVLAALLLKGKKIKRITGFQIHEYFINRANKESLKVFYFGSSPQTLKLIEIKNNSLFPLLKAEYFSPPFKEKFSYTENSCFIKKINQFKPDIIFVGMTAPKQEKWVYSNFKNLNCKIFISIGAVFDFYSGNVKRPNQFFQRIGLEWFIRFLAEPQRLFKRNFISLPVFLKDLFLARFKF